MSTRRDPTTGNDLISQGITTAFNVTPGAPLTIAAQGRITRISVIASGTTPGTFFDASGVASTGIANQIGVVASGFPAANPYLVDWPFYTGLTVIPGTNGILSILYQLERPGPG
jgi:hypothetical protein